MLPINIRSLFFFSCFLLLFFLLFFSIYQLYPLLISHNAIQDHVFFFITFLTVFISTPYTTNLFHRQYSSLFFRMLLLSFFVFHYTLMRYNPLLHNYPYYIRILFQPTTTQEQSYNSTSDWLFMGTHSTQLTSTLAPSAAS